MEQRAQTTWQKIGSDVACSKCRVKHRGHHSGGVSHFFFAGTTLQWRFLSPAATDVSEYTPYAASRFTAVTTRCPGDAEEAVEVESEGALPEALASANYILGDGEGGDQRVHGGSELFRTDPDLDSTGSVGTRPASLGIDEADANSRHPCHGDLPQEGWAADGGVHGLSDVNIKRKTQRVRAGKRRRLDRKIESMKNQVGALVRRAWEEGKDREIRIRESVLDEGDGDEGYVSMGKDVVRNLAIESMEPLDVLAGDTWDGPDCPSVQGRGRWLKARRGITVAVGSAAFVMPESWLLGEAKPSAGSQGGQIVVGTIGGRRPTAGSNELT